jgi:hypothetical protein
MKLIVSHINADHPRSPGPEQAIGEPPRGLPHIEDRATLHREIGVTQSAFKLKAASRYVAGLSIVEQTQHHPKGQIVAVFGDITPGLTRPTPLHATSDEALGLRARTRQPLLHHQLVGTHDQ